MGFATVAQLLEGVAQLRRELRNSRATRDLHAKTPQLGRNSRHSRRNSTARPLPLKSAGQIRSPGSSPRAATDPAGRGARISMAAAVQWSCGYSCGRVAPGGAQTQLRNSAQLSCATHRNSTATRSQLLRNSAATPHSDCLWAALPGFYDPTRCGEPAYGPGEGVGEIPVRFVCVGGQRFRRKASCNCCATPPQLLRNSAATRPQLLATQLRNSPQLPRNSRVAQLLRNSCELRNNCARVAQQLRTHEFGLTYFSPK